MDRQEYLGFVAILENAMGTIEMVRHTLAADTSNASSQLRVVSTDLGKAIMAYREKANAQRS
jgi:hypothetical protein